MIRSAMVDFKFVRAIVCFQERTPIRPFWQGSCNIANAKFRGEAYMWYIKTRGFTLQEIFIMAAMNVASGVKNEHSALPKAAKAASATGNGSECVF